MTDDPPDSVAPSVPRETQHGAVLDTSRMRRFSVRTRLLGIAAVGVLVIVALTIGAATGIVALGSSSDRIDELSRASDLNARTVATLRALHDLAATPLGGATGARVQRQAEVDELAGRLERLALQVDRLLGPDAFELVRAATTADARAVQTAEQLALEGAGSGDAPTATQVSEEREAFEEASRARAELDEAIAERRGDALDRLDAQRRRTFAVVAGVAVAGTLVVLAAAAIVVRSVILPLRALGRSIRRFGDGDLRSRGVEAPDEIGTLARSFNLTAAGLSDRVRDLTSRAERGTQLRIIADALDLALDEGDVHRIVEHAMGIIAPGRPMELLMSGPDSTDLHQVAVNPNGGAPNCPVDETVGCPAIRRAATMTFESPDAINSCPMLRDRPYGPCSAVCVPINAGGTLVGVLHAIGPDDEPPPPATRDQMVTLASQTGARIGSMRTLETSRVEATTDGLTGVANRRMLNATLADLLRTSTPFVLVLADLDRFKHLNDTYGHETGDRALQLFAQVLQSNVRGRDLVARYGGEEFVLVYPEMNVRLSMEVLERIRVALAESVAATNLPPFTASFGVTHSSVGADIETIVRVADAGLLMAKDLGRDRVVYSDADLAAEVFSGRGEDRAPDRDEERPAAG